MKRALVYAALMAVAMAGPLTGPLAGQQDPEQRIRATLQQARSDGLPVQLLESKVAEGRAKNVPVDRIAMVVEQRAAALGRARQVLLGVLETDGLAPEDVAVAADAIQAGVDEAAVAQIASTSDGHRRTVALAALGQLVADGIVPEEALRRVRGAMRRGNDALMNVGAGVGRPEGAGPPAGVPATGRPPGVGKPPNTGPPDGRPGGGDPAGGAPGGGG